MSPAAIRRMVDHQLSLIGSAEPAPAEPHAYNFLDAFGCHVLDQRMGKECGDCGKRFPWPGTAQSRCPSCREKHAERVAARANAMRTCVRCGDAFKAQGRATRCPDCRAK